MIRTTPQNRGLAAGMAWVHLAITAALLPAIACEPDTSSPQERLAAAIDRAKRLSTKGSFVEAMDLAAAADEWRAGLDLAREAERKVEQRGDALNGRILRAYWRAGRLEQAERVASLISAEIDDPKVLAALLDVQFARMGAEQAGALTDRLEAQDVIDERGCLAIIRARLATNKIAGLADYLHRASKMIGNDSERGRQTIASLADFLDTIGDEPLNRIARYGAAQMPLNSAFRLPGCVAMINGQGPFRLILDSGAGNSLFLSKHTVERLELKPVGVSTLLGFGGVSEVGYNLLDRVEIGAITCRRVLAHIGTDASPLLSACDGILGTGVFGDGRVTFDFEHALLRVEPSADQPGPGVESRVWLVGNLHLLTQVVLADQRATAMLDSGANVGVLSPSWLKAILPDHRPSKIPLPMFGIGPNTTMPRVAVGGELDFAGRSFANFSGVSLEDLDQVLSSSFGVQIDLLIGMSTFRHMRSWTVDYPRRRMWIDWLEDEDARNETP